MYREMPKIRHSMYNKESCLLNNERNTILHTSTTDYNANFYEIYIIVFFSLIVILFKTCRFKRYNLMRLKPEYVTEYVSSI